MKCFPLQKEKQILARRREAQRQAVDKAKRDHQQLQQQQHEEVSRQPPAAATADRIPVPSQLASIFEQLHGMLIQFPSQKARKMN
jgi:hypothetical protein